MSNQPRKSFDEKEIIRTIKFYKKHWSNSSNNSKRKSKNKENYIVVAGERRWRASKMAGLKTIDVIISDKNEKNLV